MYLKLLSVLLFSYFLFTNVTCTFNSTKFLNECLRPGLNENSVKKVGNNLAELISNIKVHEHIILHDLHGVGNKYMYCVLVEFLLSDIFEFIHFCYQVSNRPLPADKYSVLVNLAIDNNIGNRNIFYTDMNISFMEKVIQFESGSQLLKIKNQYVISVQQLLDVEKNRKKILSQIRSVQKASVLKSTSIQNHPVLNTDNGQRARTKSKQRCERNLAAIYATTRSQLNYLFKCYHNLIVQISDARNCCLSLFANFCKLSKIGNNSVKCNEILKRCDFYRHFKSITDKSNYIYTAWSHAVNGLVGTQSENSFILANLLLVSHPLISVMASSYNCSHISLPDSLQVDKSSSTKSLYTISQGDMGDNVNKFTDIYIYILGSLFVAAYSLLHFYFTKISIIKLLSKNISDTNAQKYTLALIKSILTYILFLYKNIILMVEGLSLIFKYTGMLSHILYIIKNCFQLQNLSWLRFLVHYVRFIFKIISYVC